MENTVLLTSISELVTFEPLCKDPSRSHLSEEDLGLLRGAWLYIEEGKVRDYGEGEGWKGKFPSSVKKLNCQGQLVIPGLVDSHTHPLYGGDRSLEFASRLEGKTYAEIAEEGGGIYSSVRGTEATSAEKLLVSARKRFQKFLSYGVTTLEAKSGYSLSVDEDIRQLRLLNQLKKEGPQTVKVTALPLHAVPKEQSAKGYVNELVEHYLPALQKEGLADFVDMFIEEGYFQAEDCEPFVRKAKDLALGVKVHAEEFTRSGGASLASRYGAVSADHLQFASYEDQKQMAENQVVATLLPGTSLYTKIPYTDARGFLKAGCQVAVASDYNPGSCAIANLPLLMSVAALHCGLKPVEALASVTFMGARALGLDKKKGALGRGSDADFLLLPFQTYQTFLASFGEEKPLEVWVEGRRQL